MSTIKGEFSENGVVKKEFEMPLDRTAFIKIGLMQLEGFRDNGNNSPDLLWEINLYKFILEGPDANAKADQYAKLRGPDGPFLGKRAIAEKLGWKVEG